MFSDRYFLQNHKLQTACPFWFRISIPKYFHEGLRLISNLEFLTQAAKFGWDKAGHTGTDSDMEALHSDSRWETVMASVQANWDKGGPERKTEALAGKVDEVAPDWSLPDVNGNMVSLSDLKGKVLNVPCYELLGGAFRTEILLYANY